MSGDPHEKLAGRRQGVNGVGSRGVETHPQLHAKFSTWLFQIAKNRILDELRSLERRPRSSELDNERLYLVDPPAERSELIDNIWRAVEALPFDQKMSLLLRDISGFSYEEIAEILDTTLSSVKWRIHQARERVARDAAAEVTEVVARAV